MAVPVRTGVIHHQQMICRSLNERNLPLSQKLHSDQSCCIYYENRTRNEVTMPSSDLCLMLTVIWTRFTITSSEQKPSVV